VTYVINPVVLILSLFSAIFLIASALRSAL